MVMPIMRSLVLAALLALSSITNAIAQGNAPDAEPSGNGQGWVVVHLHFMATDLSGARDLAQQVRAFADAQNMRTVILFPPPQSRVSTLLDGPEFASALVELGDRAVFLGGGATLNPMLLDAADREPSVREIEAFKQRAEVIATSGARGFGEIALHHLSLTAEHPYERIYGDHPLLKILMDVAAAHQLPIDLHFDPILAQSTLPEALRGNRNPENFSPNVDSFERLLASNRGAKVIWAHAGAGDYFGQYTPELVLGMLQRHSNLYLSIRPGGGPRPGAILGQVPNQDEWLSVIERYPDRFVMGSDTFIVQGSRKGAAQTFAGRQGSQAQAIRRTLHLLSPGTARKVGWVNAAALYRLAVP
jgi:hypothetical protein